AAGTIRRAAQGGNRRRRSPRRGGHAGTRLSGGRVRTAGRRHLGGPSARGREVPRGPRDRTARTRRPCDDRGSSPGDDLLPGPVHGSARRPHAARSDQPMKDREREERERVREVSTADIAGSDPRAEDVARDEMRRDEMRREYDDPRRTTGGPMDDGARLMPQDELANLQSR